MGLRISRISLAGAIAFALVVAAASPARATWLRAAAGPARPELRALAGPGPVTPADAHDPGDDTPGGPAVTVVTALPFTAVRDLAADAAVDAWDYDFYRLPMTAGHTYRVTVTGIDAGSGESDPMVDIGESADVTGDEPGEWYSLLQLGNARTDTRTADVHFTARTTGDHFVWVQDDMVYPAYPGGSYRIDIADEGVVLPGSVERIDGVSGYAPGGGYGTSDRYSVAAALAEKTAGATEPTAVIIASGLDRAAADALTAGSLSGAYDAPILLVRGDWPSRLPQATADYLLKLKDAGARPIDFMISGGPASVPESLKAVVLRYAPAGSRFSVRFGGADRYAVAAGIAARVRTMAGTSTVILTNGQVATFFYDTLAASALSARSMHPILLTKATVVPPVTLTEARRYGTKVLVGDDRAIQTPVFTTLGMTRDAGGTVTGGDWVGYSEADWGSYDRNHMARLVAEYGEDRGMTGGATIGLANKLMDALGGGAAIGRMNGTLVFTDADMMDAEWTEGWFVTHRTASAPRVVIVGGEASVEPAVEDRAAFLVGVPSAP